jgi:hypothetical protein
VPQPADPATPQFAAALAVYQARTQALRADIEARVRRLWAALGSYRNPDQARFVTQVVPLVAGGQQAMSALTAANLAQLRAAALGTPARPAPVPAALVTGAAVRNGVPPAQVYGRPFHLVWRLLDELPREPGSVDKAIASGADRAVNLALTDAQLAKQHTAARVLGQDDRVVGYRRVLEGPHSCALCLVAATQRYHRDQLMPMHPACDCSVAPIWDTADPGQTIEAAVRVDGKLTPVAELPDVHDRIAQRFSADSSAARTITGTTAQYRDALIVHEHGELGPVLAVRGAPFTGPHDI